MWVATAAAVVLVVVASALWWRGGAPGTVDAVDGPSLVPTTATTAPDPPPSTMAPGGGPIAASPELTWAPIEPVAHLSSTNAAVPFAGGLLAVGADDTLGAELRFSPDGRTWDPTVAMGPGFPRAVATDGTVAVAVGMAPQAATAWVIAEDLTWTSSPIVGADQVHAVAHTPIGFVAVGSSRVGIDGQTGARAHPGGVAVRRRHRVQPGRPRSRPARRRGRRGLRRGGVGRHHHRGGESGTGLPLALVSGPDRSLDASSRRGERHRRRRADWVARRHHLGRRPVRGRRRRGGAGHRVG